MHKRILLGGILLVLFLLINTPSIPAFQFRAAKENYQEILKERYGSLFSILDKQLQHDNLGRWSNDHQPLFFPILGIVVYGLILLLIIKIVIWVLHGVSGVIGTVLEVIRGKIDHTIETILSIIKIILQIFIYLVSIIFKAVCITGKMILTVFLLLVTLIWLVIGTIITLILTLISKLWNLLGVVVGLILDILRLIYQVVFPQGNISS